MLGKMFFICLDLFIDQNDFVDYVSDVKHVLKGVSAQLVPKTVRTQGSALGLARVDVLHPGQFLVGRCCALDEIGQIVPEDAEVGSEREAEIVVETWEGSPFLKEECVKNLEQEATKHFKKSLPIIK